VNKKLYQLLSFVVALALAVGGTGRAFASSAQNQITAAQTWTVTKSYIVDKGNVGGKGCNDTWPGTLSQPLCTVNAGLALAQPGEGVFLRAATYPSFIVTRSGTSSAYITISSYNGEKAVVSGGSDTVQLKGVSYVRIHGLEVKGATGSYGAGIRATQSSGKFPSYNIIENNIVHDNVGSNTIGILIENGSYNKVVNNKVYNNYLSGIQVLSHSSVSPSGITGNEVTGNESYNNTLGGGNTDGIKLEGAGTKNTLVMNNIVYGNADDGIDTWNTSNNVVVGNVAYGQTGSGDGNGFKLGGGGTGGYNIVKQNIAYGNKRNGFDSNGTGGNRFYNNIAYNNTNFGFEDGWKDAPCTPATCQQTFINNIGYNNVRGNLSASAYTTVSHNNLWYSDGGSAKVFYNYALQSNLSSFYSASGNRLDNPSGGEQASLQADPQFVDTYGGVFTVHASSPAIDRGDPANPAGVMVVNRGDIGVFESGSSPAPTQVTATQTATAAFTPTSVPVSPTALLPTATATASAMPIAPTFTPTATAIVVEPTSTEVVIDPAGMETVYDDKNGAFVYSSGWKNIAKPAAYNGSFKKTTVKKASVKLNFTGESFSIFYTSGPSYGKMKVYVDGVLVGTINQKTSAVRYQMRWDYPGQLTPGSHVLKLVVSNPVNIYSSLDQVIVR
jgi:parallel beta-helix repeat protein